MHAGRNPPDTRRGSRLHSTGARLPPCTARENEPSPLCAETGLSASASSKVEVRSRAGRVRECYRGTEEQEELHLLKGMPWATQGRCLRSSSKDLLTLLLLMVGRLHIPHLALPSLHPNALEGGPRGRGRKW